MDGAVQACRRVRQPHAPVCPAAQGRCAARHDCRRPPGSAPVHRQADRAAAELRRAGGHRDGERAADHRDARGAWSSRPRPPRSCRSSIPRPATSRRCSTRCWRRRTACAAPPSAVCDSMTASSFRAVATARRAGLGWRSICASRLSPTPGVPPARLLDGERIVHVADMAAMAADGRDDPRARGDRRRRSAHRTVRAAAQGRRAARRHRRFIARRCGRSPTSRSRCCRTSRRRRSSRWRTRG